MTDAVEFFAHLEAREALDETGLGQGDLVRRIVHPARAAFLADLTLIRAEIDQALSSREPAAHPAAERETDDHRRYPLGQCKPIRDQGVAKLTRPTEADLDRPAIDLVSRFVGAGGVVKGIWGIQKGRYFQNAIQLGDLWVDLANDTVDLARDPVEVLPLAEAQFEEITSFERFAAVAEIYWGYRAYPNLCLPELAPMFPVLLVQSGLSMRLPAPATLAPRNIRLGFEPARNFLTSSAYSERPVPTEVIAALDRLRADGSGVFDPRDGPPPTLRVDGAGEALRAVESEARLLRDLPPDRYVSRFQQFNRRRRRPMRLDD